ncbi:MAG: TRAP transporter small permease subunit, partial [Spirochaetales bacterium]|nr:TRAP transporter small permease subunit [Spirochaetales bacterium]
MKHIKKIMDFILGASVFGIFIILLIQIFFRSVLGLPSTWTVEMAKTLFTITVFLGFPILLHENKHMKVESFNSIPFMNHWITKILKNSSILLFLIFFFKGAVEKSIESWEVRIPTLEFMNLGSIYLVI